MSKKFLVKLAIMTASMSSLFGMSIHAQTSNPTTLAATEMAASDYETSEVAVSDQKKDKKKAKNKEKQKKAKGRAKKMGMCPVGGEKKQTLPTLPKFPKGHKLTKAEAKKVAKIKQQIAKIKKASKAGKKANKVLTRLDEKGKCPKTSNVRNTKIVHPASNPSLDKVRLDSENATAAAAATNQSQSEAATTAASAEKATSTDAKKDILAQTQSQAGLIDEQIAIIQDLLKSAQETSTTNNLGATAAGFLSNIQTALDTANKNKASATTSIALAQAEYDKATAADQAAKEAAEAAIAAAKKEAEEAAIAAAKAARNAELRQTTAEVRHYAMLAAFDAKTAKSEAADAESDIDEGDVAEATVRVKNIAALLDDVQGVTDRPGTTDSAGLQKIAIDEASAPYDFREEPAIKAQLESIEASIESLLESQKSAQNALAAAAKVSNDKAAQAAAAKLQAEAEAQAAAAKAAAEAQAKADADAAAAKKGCQTSPSTSGATCFWMQNWPNWSWQQWSGDYNICKSLDSCSAGGGRRSGGGCYKWSVGTDGCAASW